LWVSVEDFMRVLIRAIDDDTMTGLYHVTAPSPVRNGDMMATYRQLAGRRFGLSSPAWVAQAGAWLIGSDPALALTGRRAVPTRLLDEGYEFVVPQFEEAAARAVAAG
jgi:NAD dependent epimerase/dehydratase family enzyme